MKRLPATFLLCLAMYTLPMPGAAAAIMVSGVADAAGLSMSERHVALKAAAEAQIAEPVAVVCTEANSAAQLPELPPEALEHRRHAVRMTPAPIAAYLPLPAERQPARRC